MSLEEDLKAKSLALISQQMANWVVEIQRQISDLQANFVRSLDELQESVARYDERINEGDIEMAMAEVVANQPPAAASGPGYENLRSSLSAIERGTSLSEVLSVLVNEASQHVDRVAMFIVKGPSAIGWYARGVEPPDMVKQINVPLTSDTVFRSVTQSRQSFRGHISQTPGTAQTLARLDGNPQGVLAVPLVLRDKPAAVLYCDSVQEEIPGSTADLIEVLVLFGGKVIDILSLAPKPAAAAPQPRPAPAPPPPPSRPATMPSMGGDEGGSTVMMSSPVGRSAPPRPAPPPPSVPEEASSTVMFSPGQFGAAKQAAAAPRPAAPPPPPAPSLSPEEQKAHEDAKRFARLVVSEIKLYNEPKVNEGRKNKDLYERLKEDIERGRQMYSDRVASQVRDSTNYFYDELVRILAGGDASALGPM
ncbi:MAG TPA: hypothetical protein VGL15_14510 [Vicinamibacteria bacterium]|jgi:hypothetical protein